MNPRILFLPAVLTAAGTASAQHIQTPPNIVVIPADGPGFSDPGSLGSEGPASHNSATQEAAAPHAPAC